jgi:protein-S-isoprenylcysteine O-methyltransferase Ste14
VWAQFAVMGAVIGLGFLPPYWPAGAHWALTAVGGVLAAIGGGIAVWASRLLGRGFTPYPKPLPSGELVVTGPYGVVRHPIYGAGLLFFLGFSIYASLPALAATGVLAVVWALKGRVEERHLRERYPVYDGYASRVRYRLVPFVY